MKTVGLHGAKLVLREEQLASGFTECLELRQEAVTAPGGGGLCPVTAGSMLDPSPTRAGPECPPSDPFCLMLVYMVAFMSVIKWIL